ILVLDIETVSQKPTYAELPDPFRELWDHKVRNTLGENETPADVYPNAGLYAEFGKIICISAGVFHSCDGTMNFRIKSFVQADERVLFADFSQLLHRQPPNFVLRVHNAKGFDFPYLCRRLLINN